jgi:hypothetical protein
MNNDPLFPEFVTMDGDTLQDVCWLLQAVEEFVMYTDIDRVKGLVEFANPHLSIDGLSKICGQLVIQVRRQVAEAR